MESILNPRGRSGAAAFFCLLLSFACSHREPARTYPFRGTVVRIDPNSHVASIHNEDIPGWMTPMTMEYPVEPRAILDTLHPGDNITATVNVTKDRYWLTDVRKSPGK